MPELVILDTDIGSDIDDAVALAYLLRQPRCRLLGITTVTGNVAQRAACAEVICRASSQPDIPIHCGCSMPLLIGPGQSDVPQYAAIQHRPHSMNRPRNSAVEFLRGTIREHPHEITLLTIGPLTNIAVLFAVDPEIPSLLKQLICMAGVFFAEPDKREWNALVDPIAAAMVYSARAARHISIGLDVTLKCQLPASEVRARFTGSPLDVVAEMAEVWFSRSAKLTFHDPLAAAAIFRPELCEYVDGSVAVTIDPGDEESGHTRFTPLAAGPQRVAKDVDVGAFFAEYFSVFA